MVEATGRERASTVVIGRTGKNIINYLQGYNTYPNKKFDQVKPANKCDNDGIAVNSKFNAVIWEGKGKVAVFGHNDWKRFSPGHPTINCHKGDVTDIAWNPHSESLLATACEDGKLRFFEIQDEKGVNEIVSSADAEFDAHDRKILGFQWHKQTESLLASYGLEQTVKIWDVAGSGDPAFTLTELDGAIQHAQWSLQGNTLAGAFKTKNEFVVVDPRAEDSAVPAPTGLSTRGTRLQWVNDDTILTTGFDTDNNRGWSVVDLRNTSAPLAVGKLTSGVSNCFTYFDSTLSYFILAGRGDNSAEFYSLDTSAEKIVDKLGDYKFNDNNLFFTLMDKQVVDCNNNELQRAVRIGSKYTCEVYSFHIPSKQGGFNKDYFPPFISSKAVNEAEEWIGGKDVAPELVQLQPKKKEAKAGGKGLSIGRQKTNAGAAAAATQESKPAEDTEGLKKEIADLKAQLEAAQSAATAATATTEDLNTKPVLGYWDIRGLGQQIRTMFAYLGVDFEDVKYSVTLNEDMGKWDFSQWSDVKYTLGLEYPNLPYLIDGETSVTETAAIMKYVAKKWDATLLGKTAAETGRVEMLYAHVNDMKGKCTGICYKGEKQGDELKDTIAEDCQPILERLFEVIQPGQWAAGETLTWLDFFLAEVIEYLEAILDQRFVALVPASHEYLERFLALDAIKAYYADETRSMKAPWNNKIAVLGQNA